MTWPNPILPRRHHDALDIDIGCSAEVIGPDIEIVRQLHE